MRSNCPNRSMWCSKVGPSRPLSSRHTRIRPCQPPRWTRCFGKQAAGQDIYPESTSWRCRRGQYQHCGEAPWVPRDWRWCRSPARGPTSCLSTSRIPARDGWTLPYWTEPVSSLPVRGLRVRRPIRPPRGLVPSRNCGPRWMEQLGWHMAWGRIKGGSQGRRVGSLTSRSGAGRGEKEIREWHVEMINFLL